MFETEKTLTHDAHRPRKRFVYYNMTFIRCPQFLLTQRKNVEWARRVLRALPEIDVGRVGVKGAKKYFEAKQPLPITAQHKHASH